MISTGVRSERIKISRKEPISYPQRTKVQCFFCWELLSARPFCRDIAQWNFPPRPSSHIWPWLPTACRLVQHYQSLRCSRTCFCLQLLPLAFTKKRIFITPSSWSHVGWQTRCHPWPATKTGMKSENKQSISFVIICSRLNGTGRCC